ncbi:hypothetical protein G3M48_000347 [Beauveria asiatica]|uniref:Uncharacterized protein n=1 Tax=Beauveria asiatica TaxID=1069075 RepID=A0AAW0RGI3_9HYPO
MRKRHAVRLILPCPPQGTLDDAMATIRKKKRLKKKGLSGALMPQDLVASHRRTAITERFLTQQDNIALVMNRPRSVSRHPSLRPKDDSVSPTRSRSRPPSAASSYRDSDRPRSRPRAPHARQQREQVAGSSNSNSSSSGGSGLSRSAGVLAGIGIAALVARRLWPKGSDADEKRSRGSDGGRSHHTRRDGAKEQAPRGRDVERRAHRPAGHVPSREHGQGRLAMRAEYHPDYHLRVDRRSRGSQDAQSQMQSSSGYGRRYS